MESMEVLEQVIAGVEEVMKISDVTGDSNLYDDLEMESMDFYELLGALENVFRVKIPERVLAGAQTVADIADAVSRILAEKG